MDEWKEFSGYWQFEIDGACVTLQRREPHCDRGHWVGKVFGVEDIDEQGMVSRAITWMSSVPKTNYRTGCAGD